MLNIEINMHNNVNLSALMYDVRWEQLGGLSHRKQEIKMSGKYFVNLLLLLARTLNVNSQWSNSAICRFERERTLVPRRPNDVSIRSSAGWSQSHYEWMLVVVFRIELNICELQIKSKIDFIWGFQILHFWVILSDRYCT